jgi:AcrR family transcriptional regulator
MCAANQATGATRGEATRDSLIASAIEVFGRDGFSAASTRAISQAAGVNQALIGYHFGGKPGLYRAALSHIANSVRARLEPLLSSIESELSACSPAETTESEANQALEMLHRLNGAFVQMLTSDESAPWARLILREQQQPSDGFDILYDGIMHRMFSVTTQLVHRARKGKKGAQQAKLTAVTILGQALVFRAARTAVMRQMDWDRLDAAEVETIKAMLRRNVTAMLESE